MNLRRATIFVRVAELGGISAAARSLAMPKSAVSLAVAQLEHELGVRLLNRSSRTVTLTDAGAELQRRAAPALRSLDEAAAAASDAQGELRGRVRLTTPVEVGSRLIEPLLARFLKSHPAVTVEVMLTTKVVDLVADRIDLAVRGGPIVDESLVAKPLGLHRAALFASPAYLAHQRRPRRLADLATQACVVYRPVSGEGTWSLEGPAGRESVVVRARVGADHYAYLVRAAVSGLGIGLFPVFLCQAEVERGELVRVLSKYAVRDTPLHILSLPAHQCTRTVLALRDFLVKEMAATFR